MEPIQDIFPCHKCNEMTHIDDLDAKDDGTGNFLLLECEKCYGEGYVSAEEQWGPNYLERRKK